MMKRFSYTRWAYQACADLLTSDMDTSDICNSVSDPEKARQAIKKIVRLLLKKAKKSES